MVKRLVKSAAEGLLATDFFRRALRRHASDFIERPRLGAGNGMPDYVTPPADYALGTPNEATAVAPIFVTARFRSGSTLVWNLFRQLHGCTAYYEPLNERRWFLPSSEGKRTDATHLGVRDYGTEYRGMNDLDGLFHRDWTFRNLYMDETSVDWHLYQYIDQLIRRAPALPVLQFNRVDFRLRWLRAWFPRARILHLYRNPRDQWVSTLRGNSNIDTRSRLADFEAADRFYLLPWWDNLRGVFPCLDIDPDWHPYCAHYLLWRLSWLHGREHAEVSVAYETLVENFADTFGAIAAKLELPVIDSAALAGVIQGDHSPRWPRFADAEWFSEQEARCETLLAASTHPVAPVASPLQIP